MLKAYCYSKCTTCKKALKWLDEQGIKYELKDIKTEQDVSAFGVGWDAGKEAAACGRKE